jgi:hypothetical protein
MNTQAKRSSEVESKLKQRLIQQAINIEENASLYLEIESMPLNGNGKIVTSFNSVVNYPKNIEFLESDTIEATLHSNSKAGVLVSCSHRRAGGGWLSGSLAQEESVSRVSSWAVQAGLPEFKSWYEEKKPLFWLGQTGALVIDGLIIVDENFKELVKSKQVIFAGVAAANKGSLNNDIHWDSDQGKKQRKEQLIHSLACSFYEFNQREVTDVILCAFGTNVFGWKFEESLEVLFEASKLSTTKLNLKCAVCSPEKVELAKEIYQELMNQEQTSKKKIKP